MDFRNRNSRDMDFRNVPYPNQSFSGTHGGNMRSPFHSERHGSNRYSPGNFPELSDRSKNFDECSMESMERTHEDLDDFNTLDVVQYPMDKIRMARNAPFESSENNWSQQSRSQRSADRRSRSRTRRKRSPSPRRDRNVDRHSSWTPQSRERNDRSRQQNPPMNLTSPSAMPKSDNFPAPNVPDLSQNPNLMQVVPNLQSMVANISQMIAASITQSIARGNLPQVASGIAQFMGGNNIQKLNESNVAPSGFQDSLAKKSWIDQNPQPNFSRNESFVRQQYCGSEPRPLSPSLRRFPERQKSPVAFFRSQSPMRIRSPMNRSSRSPMNRRHQFPLRRSPFNRRSPISPRKSPFSLVRTPFARNRSPIDPRSPFNSRIRSPPRQRPRLNSRSRSPLNPQSSSLNERPRSQQNRQPPAPRNRRRRPRNRSNKRPPGTSQIHNPRLPPQPTFNPKTILSKMAETVKAVQAMNNSLSNSFSDGNEQPSIQQPNRGSNPPKNSIQQHRNQRPGPRSARKERRNRNRRIYQKPGNAALGQANIKPKDNTLVGQQGKK